MQENGSFPLDGSGLDELPHLLSGGVEVGKPADAGESAIGAHQGNVYLADMDDFATFDAPTRCWK